VDSADWAAVRALVPEEPVVPVRARRVLARQHVLAEPLLRLAVLVPVDLAVLVQRSVPADPLPEDRPVLARLVLPAAVPADLLLSRRSC
jgi:hypothetical protein